jgi:hypothetical protein
MCNVGANYEETKKSAIKKIDCIQVVQPRRIALAGLQKVDFKTTQFLTLTDAKTGQHIIQNSKISHN